MNTITGIGSIFLKKGFFQNLVIFLYRISQKKAFKVFFQNFDDIEFFLQNNILKKDKVIKVAGSGIDLEKFKSNNFPSKNLIRFLFIGRLLEYKGIKKFLKLSEELSSYDSQIEFHVIGSLDTEDSKSISFKRLEYYINNKFINYHQEVEDVRKFIDISHCIILPSDYREGVPRALLEAAAMSRPIITSDSVGCRDVVDDKVNGYLCDPNSYTDLKNKTIAFIKLTYKEKKEMGIRGRKKMINEFNVEEVVKKYLEIIG